jgi:50S ribosomal protein L16 3-hydroxylase
MLSSLADFAIDNNLFNQRYTDKELASREFSGEIKQQEVARFKHMLQQLLETDQFSNWTAQFLSQGANKQEFEDQDIQNFSHQEIDEKLKAGISFVRCPGIKAVFLEQPLYSTEDFMFYIQDEAFSVPCKDKELTLKFLHQPIFILENNQLDHCSVFFTELVTTMANLGYWYPE